MNISYISKNTLAFTQESVFSSLTPLQKRVLIVASIALSCLLACLLIVRCCFQAKLLNGPGNHTLPNGDREKGEFKDGKLHGQGERIESDGTIEKGKFEKGELNGPGKRTYRGFRAEGEFKDGLYTPGNRLLVMVHLKRANLRKGS